MRVSGRVMSGRWTECGGDWLGGAAIPEILPERHLLFRIRLDGRHPDGRIRFVAPRGLALVLVLVAALQPGEGGARPRCPVRFLSRPRGSVPLRRTGAL